MADKVWYPVWDRGLRLDHSVRTVKEAMSAADGDLKVALGLLDARHIAGDDRITADLQKRVGALWRKRAKKWIPQLRDAAAERHDRFGEVAFLLEPEIKEGRGGLRDIALLRTLDDITTVLTDLIGPLDGAADVLKDVRAAMHVHAGRPIDRLLLQDQDGVATHLGLRDADELLGRVSRAARAVAFVWDDCWRRLEGWLDPRRRSAEPDRPLGHGIAIKDGEVHAHGPAATTWLTAAAAAAELHVPIARRTLTRFVAEVPPAPDPWPFGWRHSFVTLLAAGSGAIATIEALDHYGLMSRLLPEWETVRSKPQRNAYHRFTVDRHLVETAARAASLTRLVSRPDLLLLAALFHDLGKGMPGDHTDAGVELVARIGPRMGLPPADVAVLVRLVRHHLLLADAATRRDIDDPATVDAVAAAVHDQLTLELLDALTEADSLATGSSAWSEWKAGLVRRLVAQVAHVLAGKAMATDDEANGDPVSDLVGGLGEALADGLHRLGDGRCAVVAPDRKGLFSDVAGVLALNGLDVLAASAAMAPDGRAVEVFDVVSGFGDGPDWPRLRDDVDALLAGRLALGSRLADRSRSYRRRDAALAGAPAVTFDNEGSRRATIVEVRAPDEVGALHAITGAIAAAGLDIKRARVSTLGPEVIDAFYVVDASGAKVDDAEVLADLERAILAALSDSDSDDDGQDASGRST